MAKTITNIFKFSLERLVTNIRHQHRYNRKNSLYRIIVTICIVGKNRIMYVVIISKIDALDTACASLHGAEVNISTERGPEINGYEPAFLRSYLKFRF